MQLPRLISINLLLPLFFLAAQKVCAQFAPADDFFNSGAQFYISNNIPSALEKVESGLKIYPDDEKLKKLEALLKQQRQQNQEQQQNQQRNSQAQQKPEEQNQSGQKKDEQQKRSEQQRSSDEKKNGEKPDNQNAEGQPVEPGRMTPEEAKRLLDSQKGDEQVLQLKPKGSPQNSNRPFKDW